MALMSAVVEASGRANQRLIVCLKLAISEATNCSPCGHQSLQFATDFGPKSAALLHHQNIVA
jgi:hypothetical protein